MKTPRSSDSRPTSRCRSARPTIQNMLGALPSLKNQYTKLYYVYIMRDVMIPLLSTMRRVGSISRTTCHSRQLSHFSVVTCTTGRNTLHKNNGRSQLDPDDIFDDDQIPRCPPYASTTNPPITLLDTSRCPYSSPQGIFRRRSRRIDRDRTVIGTSSVLPLSFNISMIMGKGARGLMRDRYTIFIYRI